MEFEFSLKKIHDAEAHVDVPEGVTEIGASAFRKCMEVKTVQLPSTCTAIGDYAFDGCASLEQIYLPESLQTIGSFAFKGCRNLREIILPPLVKSIPKQVFAYCRSLVSIRETQNVHVIGRDAFSGCVALEEFDARGAETIEDRAFSGCRSLVHIQLGAELHHVGSYAFRSCVSLESLALPSSITSLGSNPVTGCPKVNVTSDEATVRLFPDSFPRDVALSYGVLRPQDMRDLTAEFRKNHAEDAASLEDRRQQLDAQAQALRDRIHSLGVMDLKQRDQYVAALEPIDAELQEVIALLQEIEHPSLRSLTEEFVGAPARS